MDLMTIRPLRLVWISLYGPNTNDSAFLFVLQDPFRAESVVLSSDEPTSSISDFNYFILDKKSYMTCAIHKVRGKTKVPGMQRDQFGLFLKIAKYVVTFGLFLKKTLFKLKLLFG